MHESARRRRLSPRASIEDEIARLRDLDLRGLRVRWRNAFGKSAPEHLTRHLLFRVIAYRLQADRFGDLDADTPGGKDEASIHHHALVDRNRAEEWQKVKRGPMSGRPASFQQAGRST